MDVEEGAFAGSRTLGGHLREGCTEPNLKRWRNSVNKGGAVPEMHARYQSS